MSICRCARLSAGATAAGIGAAFACSLSFAQTLPDQPPPEAPAGVAAAPSSGTTAPATVASPPGSVRQLGRIDVTATALRNARIDLSPKIGTTVYTLDSTEIDDYGAGANAAMSDVLLRLPGVAQDSKASGSLHVRDEHGNVQYRINGVELPEGINGFGEAFDSRFVDQIGFVTGALPAQYGLRTAGVVEIDTKDGSFVQPGGSIGLQVGGHGLVQPSIELVGSRGALSYYATGTYLDSGEGIENPQPTRDPLHDRTRQARGFGYLSYAPSEDVRVGLMLGSYTGRFEIPNNPGQTAAFALAGVSDPATGFNARPSADLDENQREQNHYAILTLQRDLGRLNFQASVYAQYSELHYLPDPQGGDLVYLGVSSDVLRSDRAAGLQADASYKADPSHTIRFGIAATQQRTQSDNQVGVFDVDASGMQTSNVPITIVDDSSERGWLAGAYIQDEWRIAPKLTLNYGLRYDQVSAFTSESQWSPRINLLWNVTPATALHAGYSRYFTPPPQELVAEKGIELYAGTTNAPEVPYSDPVRAERSHYFDVGVSHTLAPGLTAAIDAYYKEVQNLLDEGQFGQALILTPFNYAQGHAEGVELSTTYADRTWNAYANLAISRAKGRDIVSGQSLFGADELAYIADHSIYLDHDQRYSFSTGVAWHSGPNRLSADLIAGSGLRNTPPGAAPNSGRLPGYVTMNLSAGRTLDFASGKSEVRVGVINLFDRVYLLRDGTGVGVGAPQYGARRTWFASFSRAF